jgi:hypothetical protein
MGPDSRVLWVMRRAPFASLRARVRGVWHYIVRRHRYEICMACGRPVGPHTGSWWRASDELWQRVIGDPTAVVCPPCFTSSADAAGIAVRWEAIADERPSSTEASS